MAKKQAQFRFEENLITEMSSLANSEGLTISEMVRNAIRFYIAIYERTKGKDGKLFIEYDNHEKEKCELVLPWL